jgi:hypothetical protein
MLKAWIERAASNSLYALMGAYYRLDSEPLRWLARRMMSYKQRTALLNRHYLAGSEAVSDRPFLAAAAEMQFATSSKGRRTALYTFPCEEDADIRIIEITHEDPLFLPKAPYWGNGSPLGARLVGPLPKIVAEIRDAEVEGDCLGIFAKRRFVTMLISSASPHCFATFAKHEVMSCGRVHSFRLSPKQRVKNVELGLYFASNAGYADNYFHALTDALPSLLSTVSSLSAEDRANATVLVPKSLPGSTRQLVDGLIRRAGISAMEFGSATRIRARRLRLSAYRSQMNDIVAMDRLAAFHVNAAGVKSLKAAINAFVDRVEPDADLPHLVYLSRARLGRDGKRHTTNGDAIIAMVERQGGKVLYPETMSLHEQVCYMQGARLVICDAGASIANAIFCGSDCAFIILTQSHARPNLFMSYAQALSLRIGFVYGHPIDMLGIDVAHRDIEVPIDRIEKAIAYFKADRSSGEPDGWH